MTVKRLQWGGVLDLRSIADVYTVLSEEMDLTQEWVIDCASVERMDTSWLQMLVVLAYHLKEKGGRLLLEHVPEPVQMSWQMAGMGKFLDGLVAEATVQNDRGVGGN